MVQETSDLIISNALVPTDVKKCVYSGTGNNVFKGIWDISFGQNYNYYLTLAVQNHREPPIIGKSQDKVQYGTANDIQLKNVKIEIERNYSSAQEYESDSRDIGTKVLEHIIPGIIKAGVDTPSAVGFPVTNSLVFNNLKTAFTSNKDPITLKATITLNGFTLGGESINSNKFTFPIEVCWGCLRPDTPAVDGGPQCPCSDQSTGYLKLGDDAGGCQTGQDNMHKCECSKQE